MIVEGSSIENFWDLSRSSVNTLWKVSKIQGPFLLADSYVEMRIIIESQIMIPYRKNKGNNSIHLIELFLK